MLILALLSQLIGAGVASLLVVSALRGLGERLLTHLPPAGATSARRWLFGALMAVGITSGIRPGLGATALGGPLWPFFGPGTPHLDPSLFAIAGMEGIAGAIGALRGLAFATLFLLGLTILGGILAAGRERPAGIGRGLGEASRRGGRDRGREMPLGPRPGARSEDPRDRSGEPRRLPGGGGRGRGQGPGRERREGRDRERGEGRGGEGRERESREGFREGREGFRENRESFRENREPMREPVASAARGGGPGFAGPRHGARPIPDPPAVMPAAAGAPVAAGRDLPVPRDGRR
ncbi:MAG TPA: hypothetical protein VNM87_13750 [Candidatus Udaeobacter sp.]|nr:hypothetical protein [Candidatus Udaeobacter sp.]